MNLKVLRRPQECGSSTPQQSGEGRSGCPLTGATATSSARLVGRWTLDADGRLRLAWALEPERPTRHLIARRRGTDV